MGVDVIGPEDTYKVSRTDRAAKTRKKKKEEKAEGSRYDS